MNRLRTFAFAAAVLAIAAPSGAAAQQQMVEIAVLSSAVKAGEIISANDLETQAVDARRARGALGMEEIAGLEARRPLTPGSPIRAHDLRQPNLIKKGQAVTMVVSHGNLTIAAKGKALEDGSKGNVVRVQNLSSNQVVQGEVTATGLVTVSSGGMALLAGL